MEYDFVHRALITALPYVPRPLIWRISRRYIAGTTLQDACRVVQELNAAGCTATIDVLGEDSTAVQQVDAARDLYLEALRRIHTTALDCNISVKLSEMGLRFDIGETRRVMRELLASARDHRSFVRIDMEDSSVTSLTLDLYCELRNEFDGVGVVLQSCLRRSEADAAELLGRGQANVRLCKGIYVEPEDIAYCDADDIRSAFQRLLVQLLDGRAERVGIATHDPLLVAHAEDAISKLKVQKDRYEFQMLLGVAGGLRRQLVARGHPLRVYVPFGELWFNYSMRRLRENPHIAGHIVRNLLSRR
jgi:proline dehydrogenase